MTKEHLDYIKTIERLDAEFCLLSDQLYALEIATEAKHKEYLKAKKKVMIVAFKKED
jgi:hypothetical protein